MIERIHATNFLSFEALDLNLTKGLTHIFGKVVGSQAADSNGAGKSAILSLIKWVLFGITDRGTVDSVIRHGSKGGTMGCVELQVGIDKLAIIRCRKHKEFGNSLALYKNHQVVSAMDNADAQSKVDEALGFDSKTFLRGFVFDGSMSIATMKDTEAKTFFEKLIGTNFDELHQKAVGAAHSNHQQLETSVHKLSSQCGQLKAYEQQLESLTAQEVTWQEQRTGEQLRLQQAEAAEEMAKALIMTRLNDGLTCLSQARDQATAATAAMSNVQVQVNARGALQYAVNSLKTDWDQAEASISPMPTPYTCPTCNQYADVTPEQLATHTATVATQFAWANTKKMEYHAKQQELNDTPAPDITALHAAQVESQSQVSKLVNETNELRRIINRHDNNVALWHQERNTWNVDPFEQQITKCEQSIASVKFGIADTEKDNAMYEDIQINMDLVCKMFSRQGLRSFLLDNILPHINNRLAYYLRYVTNDEIAASLHTTTGTGREKFNLNVSRRHGGKTYDSLSQGEKARLDLCLILSMFDFIQSKVPVPMLFFDELLDGLDATGVDRVLSILQEIAQKAQVFVISHNPHVQQFTDNVLTVINEKNVSRVEA